MRWVGAGGCPFAAAHVTLAGNANTATKRSSEKEKDAGAPAAGELAA